MTTNTSAPIPRPDAPAERADVVDSGHRPPPRREFGDETTFFHAYGAPFTRLPRRTLTMWRLATALITAAATLVVGGIGALLVPWLRGTTPSWPGSCAAMAVAAVGLVQFTRLPLRWARTGYHLADRELWVQEGLWSRRLAILPYGCIQAVEAESGPLQRRYGLASVVVATGSYHRLCLHNMDADSADAMHDRLMRAREQQVAL